MYNLSQITTAATIRKKTWKFIRHLIRMANKLPNLISIIAATTKKKSLAVILKKKLMIQLANKIKNLIINTTVKMRKKT